MVNVSLFSFILVDDLKKASKLLSKNPNKIILPVSKYPVPIEWALEFKKKSSNLKAFKKIYLRLDLKI